ncbi:hypothetical protein CAMGR0001_2620 [Campylobacter gracilis RM3268]|uniref:Uncharacterized protein n=1 Tax=Campylobacter gracilis RM3268 TaxID=553220 RepID=C8PEY0_9BACT|nr:hypothetical protein CAMGR0001_2620 [Campylobacter gracilis RM3268]
MPQAARRIYHDKVEYKLKSKPKFEREACIKFLAKAVRRLKKHCKIA